MVTFKKLVVIYRNVAQGWGEGGVLIMFQARISGKFKCLMDIKQHSHVVNLKRRLEAFHKMIEETHGSCRDKLCFMLV